MLLDIENLTLELPGTARPVLDRVSLRVASGEVVGLVGESGSGKSTTAKAALRTLPDGTAVSGSVRVDGTDVLALSGEPLRRHRARTVAMVHQDPRAALNPVRRIGDFLVERLADTGLDRGSARDRAVELLGAVGLSAPERRIRQRPHELSGGMLQRVVIAGALAAEPRLLLADEATSALDVTTQAEILALLRTLRAERSLGLLFITHDLHLAAAYCDRVYVMYAGRVVEEQPARALFDRPRHPYTRGLLACSPTLGEARSEIRPIPGRPPSLADAFGGCEFAERCPDAEPECVTWRPEPVPLDAVGGGAGVGGSVSGPAGGGSGGGSGGGGVAACRRLPVLSPYAGTGASTPPGAGETPSGAEKTSPGTSERPPGTGKSPSGMENRSVR